MSDNTSVIDAVRRIAKATKEDPDGTSDIVKGALHPEQIDDVRIMLSRARTGSLQGAATSSTAAAAPAATSKAGAAQRDTSVQRRQWRTTPNKASAKYQGIPPANTEANFPPLTSSTPTWGSANRGASRPRANRRERTPHPTIFATDEEIAAMTPDQRALHDAEVSLQRQKREMELRHEAETQSLYMSVEEEMVNRFRASIRESSRPPARPATAREEATTGGSSSSATQQEPFVRPWRPERLPLSQLNTDRPSTPRLEERPDRRVTFDPRGSYPQTEGKGATDRRASVERRLWKKLPAGVPRTAIFVDEHGRADMSWRNVPDNEKPPGALRGPGHGASKGIGKQSHADRPIQDAYGPGPIMDEVNPRDPDFDPAEYIPEIGSIIFEEGLTGRGRYDTLNQIFRCVVRCPHCRADMCNRRMWFALDNHSQHYCRGCQQELGLGGQPD